MCKKIYTEEMISFLRENISKYNYKKLADEFNAQFGMNKTTIQIKSTCQNKNIRKSEEKKPYYNYTDEMNIFLREKHGLMPYDELTLQFNKKFGLSKKRSAIKLHCYRMGITQRRFLYSPEMFDFIKENNSFGISRKELTKRFNDHFKTQKTINDISSICQRWGFKSKNKFIFSDEMFHFLKNIVENRTWEEITSMFNSRFGVNKSTQRIMNFCSSRGLRNGLKGGHTGHPIGTEQMHDGYTFIKTAQPNKWTPKHKFIWEEKNGPIPTGDIILFADGNKSNFNLDNLIKVNKKEFLHLNYFRLRFNDPEYTKVGIAIAKVIIKTKERQKEFSDEKSEKKNRPENQPEES